MNPMIQDLMRPGFELEETHISWVLLGARKAWKIKKPVSLGFLDFSTLEKRGQACRSEMALNRRLAPEVYLGVIPVTREKGGRHVFGGKGVVADWAVLMRRLPAADRLDRRLAEGRLHPEHLDILARRLADFHAAARCDAETSRFGTPGSVERNVSENFDRIRENLPDFLGPERAAELEAWQLDFIRERADLFVERVQLGRVRDGHGDLRLGQIYLDRAGQAAILDCIEFNDRFRYGDVCADMAFLSMDLAAHGRVDLAERFLADYALRSQDYGIYGLVDFYESYRACVRGKVALLLAGDPGTPAAVKSRAIAEARRYFLLALSARRRPLLPPALVAVGGISGSGKSTLGSRLGEVLAAPVLGSDRTRKSLLGVEPEKEIRESYGRGSYAPAFSDKVHGELMRRSRVVLQSGRPVVLDATFRSRRLREKARELARSLGAPFLFVECRAEEAVLLERLRKRAEGPSVSDARAEMLPAMQASWEKVEELSEAEYLVLDTARPPEENLERIRERLPDWGHLPPS